MVARKPRVMTAKETMKANVAKNCLILTMMSLELGLALSLSDIKVQGMQLSSDINKVDQRILHIWLLKCLRMMRC